MKLQGKLGSLGALVATLLAGMPSLAQDGPIQNPTLEQMAGMVDKGDTTWMLVSSVLVLMMAIPALALFYGGLVRSKNMLSLLMQVLVIVSIGAVMWVQLNCRRASSTVARSAATLASRDSASALIRS